MENKKENTIAYSGCRGVMEGLGLLYYHLTPKISAVPNIVQVAMLPWMLDSPTMKASRFGKPFKAQTSPSPMFTWARQRYFP